MEKLGPRVRVRTVEPLRDFKVRVTFENDTQREIDLKPAWMEEDKAVRR